MKFTASSGFVAGQSRRWSETFSSRRDSATLTINPAVGADADTAVGNENPLLQSPGTTFVIDLYRHLHLAIATGTVPLRIPETLLVSEEGEDILLYTDENGDIAAGTDQEPFAQFIQHCADKLTEISEFNVSECPLYIFSTADSASKAIFSPAEAAKVWITSRNHTKLLQRYIPPHSNLLSKIRLIWTRGDTMKRFTIKKRGVEILSQKQQIKRTTKLPSLSRSSTSHRLILKKEPLPLVEDSTSPRNAQSFLVSSRQEADYVWDVIPTPVLAAERFFPRLREVLNQFLLHEDEVLVEVAYDVLQDLREEYYFLNVKWVRVESTAALTLGSVLHSQALRKRFTDLMSTDTSPKVPFVDMHEVTSNNVKFYMCQLDSFSAIVDKETSRIHSLDYVQSNLTDAENKLDSLAQTLSVNKLKNEEEQRARLTSYFNEGRLESIISSVYSKASHDPELKDLFSSMKPREIDMFKTGFSKVFSNVQDSHYQRTVNRVPEFTGVTKTHFDRFVCLLEESMTEADVPPEYVSMVRRHLLTFRDEVVETDR